MTTHQTRELALIRRGTYRELTGSIVGHGMEADGSMWVTMGGRGWSRSLSISATGEISHVG